MGNDQDWQPKDAEEALAWREAPPPRRPHHATLMTHLAGRKHKELIAKWVAKRDAARKWLFKHASHGVVCKGIMTRREVIEELAESGQAGLKRGRVTARELGVRDAMLAVLGCDANTIIDFKELAHEAALLDNADRDVATSENDNPKGEPER